MKIEELNLSQRSYNLLKRSNINTTEDLCNKTVEDMWRIRNLGRMCLQEILGVVKEQGMKFREVEEISWENEATKSYAASQK